jgi:outer membrane scaffolding protein for murein synthesis (MipA/OmpV family)
MPMRALKMVGLASYRRLLGDAEDSLVVDDEGDKNQFTGGILVFYKFERSLI